ncbi:hypothetical protein HYFRA_00011497 [Hymenoscyphus fraxineus]|uniref:DUF7704 domain-containing protein n=1 Tax=Hymenoscyphus fraxineus TaxID=746836 RepID=A0A9N9PT16_9HELO|nr:hypothetical protein HYFRA_00011497 [Hymenoscyphus fraxineus]
MALPVIHVFYHFWFKWLDPIVLAPTIFAIIFTPQAYLDAFIPPPLSAFNPDHGFVLHQLAAMFTFVAIALGGILRVSHEIKVWRVVIAGILLVDIAMLASAYISLQQQGRLSLGAMRLGDWGNILFTGLVTVIRIAFLAGVGVGVGAGSEDELRSKSL